MWREVREFEGRGNGRRGWRCWAGGKGVGLGEGGVCGCVAVENAGGGVNDAAIDCFDVCKMKRAVSTRAVAREAA